MTYVVVFWDVGYNAAELSKDLGDVYNGVELRSGPLSNYCR
jgi:hypothetical protein